MEMEIFTLISVKRGTMFTKKILMIITIILFGISNVYARETIKTCSPHTGGFSFYNKETGDEVKLDKGEKPFGDHVENLLTLTNKLKLELIFTKGDSYKECLDKLKIGQIDIMTVLGDKNDRRDWLELIPFLSCSKFNDNCPGNNSLNFGISKASKFASRVNEFKSALLDENEYLKIRKTKFTSSAQHEYWSVKPESVSVTQGSGCNKDSFENIKKKRKGHPEWESYVKYSDMKSQINKYITLKGGLHPKHFYTKSGEIRANYFTMFKMFDDFEKYNNCFEYPEDKKRKKEYVALLKNVLKIKTKKENYEIEKFGAIQKVIKQFHVYVKDLSGIYEGNMDYTQNNKLTVANLKTTFILKIIIN